jgi:hypothetical protein
MKYQLSRSELIGCNSKFSPGGINNNFVLVNNSIFRVTSHHVIKLLLLPLIFVLLYLCHRALKKAVPGEQLSLAPG